jgi:CheY-like chemotaxis protein
LERLRSMSKCVMVVDDDKDVQEIVTFVLNCNGIEVVNIASGQHLQQMLSLEHTRLPDLIILDVMMPGVDGYQLCQRLRKDPRTRHIPIIIITAHAEGIYQRISSDLGAALHMTKPFHPMALLEQVQTLLQ